jgi:hypothetical protein
LLSSRKKHKICLQYLSWQGTVVLFGAQERTRQGGESDTRKRTRRIRSVLV